MELFLHIMYFLYGDSERLCLQGVLFRRRGKKSVCWEEVGVGGFGGGGPGTLSENMPHALVELGACTGSAQGYRRGLCSEQ